MFNLGLCVLFLGLVVGEESPTVRVTQGVLKGGWRVSAKGREYASFQGIPYAQPPIGKNRFREPQRLKQWSGVWDANRTLSACIQYNPFNDILTGDENCLFLNVYTPQLTTGAALPVMVFIHGGEFMYGSGGIYSPVYLMDRDMVVVTINYRLGPLGFLSTADETSPGNYGLKDQAFALHWVKDNIAMFGGNPDAITLSGHTAGASSVHYHFLSPLSKGTFTQAIALSGSAFLPWSYQMKPAEKAQTLAGIVGCPTDNHKDMVECLRNRPAEVVTRAQIPIYGWKIRLFSPFSPTKEESGVRGSFITDYPYRLTQAGDMEKVPLLTGNNEREGLYPAAVYQKAPSVLPELERRWEELASNIFEYNDTLPLDLRPSVAAKIKQEYLGGRPVSQETFQELVQALGDRLFTGEAGRLAEINAEQCGQPTYIYRYNFRGEKSISNFLASNTVNYGVSHSDDIIHIFEYPGFENTAAEDLKMKDSLVDMVYSFVSTGIPTFPGAEWKPVKPDSKQLNYLEILSPTTSELKSQAAAEFGNRAFWDSLGFNENENYRPVDN